jgi:hypothetical protein
MALIKGLLALIGIILISAVVLAGTVGPAVAYFVWGWKVALGWFFVTSGLGSVIQAVKAFTSSDD